jgi:hypothetical protein
MGIPNMGIFSMNMLILDIISIGIPSMVLTIRDILDWTGLPLVPTSLSQVLSFVKNSFNKIFHFKPYSS